MAKINQQVNLSQEMQFPQVGRWFQSYGNLPGSKENYEFLAGHLWRNPVVQVGLRWIGDNACLPRLQVMRGSGKAKGKAKAKHGLIDLLNDPNPYYGWHDLLKAVALSDITGGDTYLLKVRDGNKQVAELYWLFHGHVTPVSLDGDFITYYEYLPLWGSQVQNFSPADIIHIRNGLDPLDVRRGLSPLKAMAREVFSDNAASTYTAAILRNMGATAYIISPKDTQKVVGPEQKAKFKEDISRATGDGTGNTLFSTSALDVTKVGLSPEDMALDMIRRWPEDRILAAMGLNSTALNLTSGSGSKTFNNFSEAIKQCYTGCLMPLLGRIAQALHRDLLPEIEDPTGLTVEYDWSEVAALREDQTALANRVMSLFTTGLIDRAEGRSLLNFEVKPEDEGVYYGGTTPSPTEERETSQRGEK